MQNTPTYSTTVSHKRTARTRMEKIRGSQTLLSIFVLLLISVLLWIMITVFATFSTSQVPSTIKNLATPLTPTLSDSIFSSIESKRVFTEEELRSFPIYVIVRDSRTQSESVVPLGSAPTPAATPAPTPVPVTPTPSPTPTTAPETPQ